MEAPEEVRARATLEQMQLRISHGPYAALGVPEGASADDVRMAWVIGCSRVKGEFVESDRLLAELFEAHGFGRTSIERFRRRHADLDLFESVVHADR